MAHEKHGRPTQGDHDNPAQRDLDGREGSVENELRVQRSEEELGAGVRERQAGEVRVRKNVRTDHEQIPVTRRREEVDIERVPVNRDAPEGEIGADDEVVVQVFEEEIVVSKKVVLKEEIRLRKEVVEEEEIIEEDVRREEVEIDDRTEHGGRR